MALSEALRGISGGGVALQDRKTNRAITRPEALNQRIRNLLS
jgi:hypothetical protein